MSIEYRLLRDGDALQQVMDLQRLVWGDDPNAYVPLHMLRSLASAGAPLLGAFDGSLLVGFSLGFLGLDMPESDRPALANLKLASKRMAVHPDYRGSGIAYHLKLEQRDFAIQQGLRLITWTFDPLISRNAHLYIRKLGAIVRRFEADFYRGSLGQIEAVPGSDRFICEWWVTSNRVEEKINGNRKSLSLENYMSGGVPLVNPAYPRPDGSVAPYLGTSNINLNDHHLLLVEIPTDHRPLSHDVALGQQWREHTRRIFTEIFASGYIVTDFIHQQYEGHERSFYVMGFDGGK